MLEGRRIVELALVAQRLEDGCTVCQHRLRLVDCVAEQKYGLASILEFRCRTCGLWTNCATSKTHFTGPVKQRCGRSAYDVNTKASLAVIAAGMNHTQENKNLSVLDIPHVKLKTKKTREREVGPVLDEVAKSSCDDACALERSLVIAATGGTAADEADTADGTSHVPITASYDMGWSKRGKAMNSITGAGALVGEKSGKVLKQATRVKRCRTCAYHEREGTEVLEHDCRHNWDRSSKAMEADVAVQLAKDLPSNKSCLFKPLLLMTMPQQ